jgi:hypothetical protein
MTKSKDQALQYVLLLEYPETDKNLQYVLPLEHLETTGGRKDRINTTACAVTLRRRRLSTLNSGDQPKSRDDMNGEFSFEQKGRSND